MRCVCLLLRLLRSINHGGMTHTHTQRLESSCCCCWFLLCLGRAALPAVPAVNPRGVGRAACREHACLPWTCVPVGLPALTTRTNLCKGFFLEIRKWKRREEQIVVVAHNDVIKSRARARAWLPFLGIAAATRTTMAMTRYHNNDSNKNENGNGRRAALTKKIDALDLYFSNANAK